MMKAIDVVDVMYAAHLNPTAGRKAARTKKVNEYVAQQEKTGHKPTRTLAGLNASLTRRVNKDNLNNQLSGTMGRVCGFKKV